MAKKLKTIKKTIKNNNLYCVYIRIYKVMSRVLTSVKVDKDAYIKFKQFNTNNKFHLQDLVNRSLHLFLQEQSFRDKLYNYNIPVLSSDSQNVQLPSLQNNIESV